MATPGLVRCSCSSCLRLSHYTSYERAPSSHLLTWQRQIHFCVAKHGTNPFFIEFRGAALTAQSGASTPLKHGRSLRLWKNEGERKSCIFSWKLGGRKIKGGGGEERLNYLSTYLHRLPLIFSKIFSLATLARLHFIFTPNQGTRNIYSKDGKVHLTFKSGKEKRRFSVLHFWWPDVTKLITQNLN